ncbi:unnamed protein product, partial [Rotaria socialis]
GCTDNNGGCDPNATCSHDATTNAIDCTCKTGYTNTGSSVNVVCKDSCTVNNGDCDSNAICSHDATTNAVKCTCKAGYTNTGSSVNVVCKDICAVNNGDCGTSATCSYNAATNAVACTCADGYIYTVSASEVSIPAGAKWSKNGVTVAGGHGGGGARNQLFYAWGLFVDDDQTVFIADWGNHRIVQYKNGDTTNGQVVAGGNGVGNGLHQLFGVIDVLIDKKSNSLIICDQGNLRVVRWSRCSGTTQGEVLIDNIYCAGLAMDEQRYLYVSVIGKSEVRRYQLGKKNYTIVAGGNGEGNGLNQLNYPTYLFVDQQQNVYVSDSSNQRVIKWNKDAKEGIVVAGGQGLGGALTQLYYPEGIFVDTFGTLYVADSGNHRVMRWTQGDNKQGTVIVGGNGAGVGANQFDRPFGLSFDRRGNLYAVDYNNHRVQRFSIE